MNEKKCKELRRTFPEWNKKEYHGKQKRKVIPNPHPLEDGFIEVVRTTISLKSGSDASFYRAIKRRLWDELYTCPR